MNLETEVSRLKAEVEMRFQSQVRLSDKCDDFDKAIKDLKALFREVLEWQPIECGGRCAYDYSEKCFCGAEILLSKVEAALGPEAPKSWTEVNEMKP